MTANDLSEIKAQIQALIKKWQERADEHFDSKTANVVNNLLEEVGEIVGIETISDNEIIFYYYYAAVDDLYGNDKPGDLTAEQIGWRDPRIPDKKRLDNLVWQELLQARDDGKYRLGPKGAKRYNVKEVE